MAKRYYELHVAGCTRQLTIMNISDTLAIASFVILGDTEIVTRTAEELAKKVPRGRISSSPQKRRASRSPMRWRVCLA